MPPKTKKGKGKGDKKKDVPTEEMVKDQLWEELLRLQEELNSVRMKKNLYKNEMHEAHGFCQYAKKNLEVTKNRMREKLRLKQEAEKQRRAEIEEHELKLRHLNAEHHNGICEVKTNAVTTTSDIQGEQLKSKLKLQVEMQRLQALKTDQRFQSHLNIRNLQLKQQNEVIDLLKSYIKKDTEIEAEYERRKKDVFNEHDSKLRTEFKEIKERLKTYEAAEIAEGDKVSTTGYTKRNANTDRLRDEAENELAKKSSLHMRHSMAVAVQENKRYKETLRDLEQKLSDSYQQLVTHRKATAQSLKESRKRDACTQEERRDLHLKENQLETKCELLQQECKELQKQRSVAYLSMQQKRSLKVMVQEKKIDALAEIQEKEQLKLYVALAFTQGDQTALKNIKDLLESKDNTIQALKCRLSQDSKEYQDFVKREKVSGVSAHELLPRFDNSDMDTGAGLSKDLDKVIQQLTSMCIPERKSDQDEALKLNYAGSESRQ